MFLFFQSVYREALKGYFKGLADSFPIVLGYFPVGIAFGIAAKEAGFSDIGAVLISVFIFAGASQFALVGMMAGGISVLFASFICLALNARHLVYGPSLSTKLKTGNNRFLPVVSFGLTDEVFSTSLSKIEEIDKNTQMAWMFGLETGAYFTWVSATWIGAFSRDIVIQYLPALKSSLSFSLPALFLTLLVSMVDRNTFFPVLVSALISILFIEFNLNAYALPAASVTGPGVWVLLRKIR